MKMKQISIADYMHAQHKKEELAKRTAILQRTIPKYTRDETKPTHYNDDYYSISYWINNSMENNTPKRHKIK